MDHGRRQGVHQGRVTWDPISPSRPRDQTGSRGKCTALLPLPTTSSSPTTSTISQTLGAIPTRCFCCTPLGNSQRWFQWVPRLAREYRVVRIDLRSHGNSEIPKPTDDFSLSLLVSDALALLDLVGATNAHIVGNSAGGYVSQQLAIRHPERIKTLALFGSTPGLKHSHAPTWIPKIKAIGLKQFLADTIDERFDHSADPQLVKWFIEQAGSNDPAFIARFVLHMCTHDFMNEL